jgi:hypothetical protein
MWRRTPITEALHHRFSRLIGGQLARVEAAVGRLAGTLRG